MDAFTMVVVACVSGEASCKSAHVSRMEFTSVEICEAQIDEVTAAMTKEFSKLGDFKGRSVTYDVSCMDRAQLLRKFGVTQSDT
ncbi:MAG: hypothetical protein ACK4VM_13900 [Bosea sp. (in: a-proteobacteria)]